MKIAALLTARAGSKSVPNKNLYPFNGKPLYLYNVAHALAIPSIEKLYISTNLPEIIQACQKTQNEKLRLIIRPETLCQDSSSHHHAILHGLEQIEKDIGQVDILIVLLGNTPHAYTEDLDKAIQGFITCFDNYDSCMSVSKMNCFNPFRAFHQLDNGTIVPIIDSRITNFLANRKNQNDKDAYGDIYYFTGSFWIIKRETLIKNDGKSVFSWLGNRIMPYIQPEGYMEIDAFWQLKLL